MKKRLSVLFFIGFLITLVSCASTGINGSKELKLDPKVVTGQMDNGMSYFVMNNKEPSNRITMRLVVKTGSCMEEDDQKGVAHFIEHLAFNGTEHFEKNSIVDFFELCGMNFGADLNAYTSFEETVYQIEIPADNPEILQKAMLILRDWACGITFDQTEIDKERGVVTEEWRSRRGLNGRILDNYIPFVYSDSQYEKRLPIGDMNVIKNISRDRILDYYKKWYRPELMSVIVVGDEKAEVLKKTVQEVMGSIPKSEQKIVPPAFNIPEKTDKEIKLYVDPEQPYVLAQLMQPDYNWKESATEADFKNELAKTIGMSILNQRFTEITMQTGCPWLGAAALSDGELNHAGFSGFAFIPKQNQFTDSLKLVFDEYDRFLLFGAEDSEIERIKAVMLQTIEQAVKNKDKTKSSTTADELVSYVLRGSVSMDVEYACDLLKRAFNSISKEDIYNAVRESFGYRGTKLFVIIPKGTSGIPSEKEIMDIWENYKTSTLTAYTDDIPEGELMIRPSSKAKIVSKQYDSDLKITEYELENGLKFYTKKTDFKNDEIRILGGSKGGVSLISDADYPSAYVACDYNTYSGVNGLSYTQLLKMLSDKKISFSTEIGSDDETIYGTSTGKDLETFLQMTYLTMTQPQFTDEGWNQIMVQVKTDAESFGSKPEDVYLDKIRKIIYGNGNKHAAVDKTFVSKIDRNTAEMIFKQRFSNGADFKFVFTGDFNEKTLVDLCCYYLGNIPGNKDKTEKAKFEGLKIPSGITSQTVKKGLEQKSMVYMVFGGNIPGSDNIEQYWIDRAMIGQLEALLDIRLREAIREEKGGSYGVSVVGGMSGLEQRKYTIQIVFGCEPSRTEELKNEVIKVIKEIQSNPADSVNVEKINETYRRNRELNLKNNGWWINQLNYYKIMEISPKAALLNETVIPELTTPEMLQKLAKEYLNTDNYVVVYLKPEK